MGRHKKKRLNGWRTMHPTCMQLAYPADALQRYYKNSETSKHLMKKMCAMILRNTGTSPDFEAQWLTPFKNELRSKPQCNSADVRAQLKSVAKVVKEFVNPPLPNEKI